MPDIVYNNTVDYTFAGGALPLNALEESKYTNDIWLVGTPWLTLIFQPVTIIAEAFVWHSYTARGGKKGRRIFWFKRSWPVIALCCPLLKNRPACCVYILTEWTDVAFRLHFTTA